MAIDVLESSLDIYVIKAMLGCLCNKIVYFSLSVKNDPSKSLFPFFLKGALTLRTEGRPFEIFTLRGHLEVWRSNR